MLLDDSEMTQALLSGDAYYVRAVLDMGGDVHARNKDGGTPLALAAELGKAELVDILLEYGADINVKDDSGFTPLIQSACIGDETMVRHLLECGADASAKDKAGRTAEDHAQGREFPVVAAIVHDYAVKKLSAPAPVVPMAPRLGRGRFSL